MKQKYISPQTVSHTLAPVLPLAASRFESNASGDQTITPDSNEPAPSEFTSRRGSVWDDEEDDF